MRDIAKRYNVNKNSLGNWISEDKFHVVLETAALSESELAREKHPEGWSGSVRDWSLPEYVCLAPMNEAEVKNFINTENDGSDEISLKQV